MKQETNLWKTIGFILLAALAGWLLLVLAMYLSTILIDPDNSPVPTEWLTIGFTASLLLITPLLFLGDNAIDPPGGLKLAVKIEAMPLLAAMTAKGKRLGR